MFLFIFIILFLIQLTLALNYSLSKKTLSRKFAFVLGDKSMASEVLEKYVKIYRKVNVKVNARIKDVAYASEEFLLVNKMKIFSSDLFTNFYLIFQLELTRKSNNYFRYIYIFHNFLFLLQFIFILFSFIFSEISEYMILASIGFLILNILLSFKSLSKYEKVLDYSLEVSKDLLNLDQLELARAEKLKNELKFKAFDYPFDLISKIFKFILP